MDLDADLDFGGDLLRRDAVGDFAGDLAGLADLGAGDFGTGDFGAGDLGAGDFELDFAATLGLTGDACF